MSKYKIIITFEWGDKSRTIYNPELTWEECELIENMIRILGRSQPKPMEIGRPESKHTTD